MEMKYSKEFVVLAKNGNYLRTAEELFMAQSTLSKHIQVLELELGQRLFLRNTRRVELTDFGRAYLAYAEEIVRIETECESKLLRLGVPSPNQIRVGMNHGLIAYEVPTLIQEFRRKNKDYDIKLLTTNNEELMEMLTNKTCDLAFVRESDSIAKLPKWNNFNAVTFCKEPLVLVVPLDHRLAQRDSVGFEELKDEPFVCLPKNTAIYKRCLYECRRHSFEPNFAKIVISNGDILDNVCAGYGIALYGKRHISTVSTNAVKVVDIRPETYMSVYIVSAKKHSLSVGASQLLKFFKRNCQKE